MQLSDDICYKAMVSRDRRFEGRFTVAVVTTGIYCRPGCPARTPRRSNVRFLPTPAAAEESGFRACRKCRPDTSPDSAAWLGTAATVARALRLIDEGVVDEGGVDLLAGKLGMGERHLRRLFMDQIGAPPRAIARTRKVHFAKKLLEETSLPMSMVALSSGFKSVRRFNAAMLSTFGRPPRELRVGGRPGPLRRPSQRSAGPRALTLRLAFKPPYDWDSLIEFMGLRAIPGVESVVGGSYHRTVKSEKGWGTFRIFPDTKNDALTLVVEVPVERGLDRLVRRVRRQFDLDADTLRIAGDLEKDPMLAPLIKQFPGLRVPGAWDGFETSVRAILGQQVSVKGATTLSGRLVEKFGIRIRQEPERLTHLFPGPEILAHADLTKIGIPKARGSAINHLARAVNSGHVSLHAAVDLNEAVSRMCALPGIGPWTANYIAMRALGEPDAIPVGDLGLRQALHLKPKEFEKRAENWRPWRAYAAMYLWKSLASRATAGSNAGANDKSVKRSRGKADKRMEVPSP